MEDLLICSYCCRFIKKNKKSIFYIARHTMGLNKASIKYGNEPLVFLNNMMRLSLTRFVFAKQVS